MKPSKYFGTSEGLVELRPSKTDDGLTMYRPVTYPCPDGLERYQSFVLQAGKFQTVVSLGIGADAEMIAHAPEDIAALVAEVERLRATIHVLTSERDSALERNNDLIEQSEKQQSRLSAVENLHRRSTYKSDEPYCETCYQAPYGYAPYPCPTICALEVGE